MANQHKCINCGIDYNNTLAICPDCQYERLVPTGVRTKYYHPDTGDEISEAEFIIYMNRELGLNSIITGPIRESQNYISGVDPYHDGFNFPRVRIVSIPTEPIINLYGNTVYRTADGYLSDIPNVIRYEQIDDNNNNIL